MQKVTPFSSWFSIVAVYQPGLFTVKLQVLSEQSLELTPPRISISSFGAVKLDKVKPLLEKAEI